jgi:serine/threonine protein kinase
MVCHRDLKPENILLVFDTKAGKLVDLKLCDFGLSTRFQSKQRLTDFCGSPGFFAPEMLTEGSYLGDKADVWSVGCILLELVLGHERFCDIWMSAYDYEVMQDKVQFGNEISVNVERLPKILDFSPALNSFIMAILQVKPEERLTISAVCQLDWVSAKFEKINLAHSTVPDSPIASAKSDHHQSNAGNKKGLLQYALSNRERRLMEEYAKSGGHNAAGGEISLPPIEPSTPDVGRARKILKKGDQLAKFASKSITEESVSGGSSTVPSSPDGMSTSPKSMQGDRNVSDIAF